LEQHGRNLQVGWIICVQSHYLLTEWEIQGDLQDQRDQSTITMLLKQPNCSQFILDGSLDDAICLSSIGDQSIPMSCSSSDVCPGLQNNENSLEQCPMSIFQLKCPFGLSDQTFKTIMSNCSGVPVPNARFLKATVPAYSCNQFLGRFSSQSFHACIQIQALSSRQSSILSGSIGQTSWLALHSYTECCSASGK
jgi:hypothetical protein